LLNTFSATGTELTCPSYPHVTSLHNFYASPVISPILKLRKLRLRDIILLAQRIAKKDDRVAQVLECQPSKHEALSLNPSTIKKK
jgi:hypothetical protein